MKGGVYQGSVLTKDVRDDSLMEMYAHDLALSGEFLDGAMGNCEKWKSVLEGQALKVY